MNKDNKYSSIKTSLNEATRTQLINKSKSSPKGKQRFNRKNKSKVANSVREFNAIDMNKLFKEGILTVGINVTGETDNYVVKISFGGFLDLLNKEITRANNKLDLRSIIRALQKGFNQENVYVHCSCPDFCLHGDTKIKLLSGEVDTIRNIIERFRAGEDLWVYSTDKHGDFKPGHIIDAWVSGYENELIEITLDNGNKVVTTKNHLYMLRNGEYERADNLMVGQSLMPMYFSYHDGYENVKMNSIHGKTVFRSVYKLVANECLSNEIEAARIRSGEDVIQIHHSDFNKLNNTPMNLKPMGILEHWKYHYEHLIESGVLDKFLAAGHEYWATQEAKDKQALVGRANFNKYWSEHNGQKQRKIWVENGSYGDSWRDSISKATKMVWDNYTEEEYKWRCELNQKTNDNPEVKAKQSAIRKEYWKNHPEKKYVCRENIKKANQEYAKLPKSKETKRNMSLAHLNEPKERADLRNLRIRDSKLNRIITDVLSNGYELTFENCNKFLHCGDPHIDKYFSSIEDVIKYFNIDDKFNHKIIEIKTISYDDPVPVYDITVDKYNNFLVDAGVVVHNCYRFNYWATFNKYDSGPEQHSNGKWIRNPTDNLGAACKHTLLVLSNNFWLIKVASVINNYIKYAEKNMKKAYADIIYPAIYKKKFEKPTQLSIFDTDNLDDSQETVNTANELGRTSGRFQQGNPYRFQSGNKPPKNQISIDEIETDEEN